MRKKTAGDFDIILNERIDHLNRGESVEACISHHPGHADRLRPLVGAMLQTLDCYNFEPSASVRATAKQPLQDALESVEQKRERKFDSFCLLRQPKVWATTAAVLLIALVSVFVLRPLLSNTDLLTNFRPPGPGIVTVAQPDPEGNFVLLASDEVNAMGDFQNLNASVLRVHLKSTSGGSEKWVEFEPAMIVRPVP